MWAARPMADDVDEAVRYRGDILSPTRPLVAYSPLTLASLRMLPCRTHCPRPSMCIMYGCGTACGTTLFARYCHVTPRQKPPKVGSGWFGDGAPPGAVRAWIGLSGRFLALAICPWRAPHAGIRGYGPRRPLSSSLDGEARGISARSRPRPHGLTPITVLWYDTTLV